MRKYLFITMCLGLLLYTETRAQSFRLKKGMVEYSDTLQYLINDSTLFKYFFSPICNLRYPVSKDSLQYVYANNLVELSENGNKIRILNGGGGSHGNDQWQLYFYHYDILQDSIIKKSLFAIRMYEQRYEIDYNPVLMAENAEWILKPKKMRIIFYDHPEQNSTFLQGYINLRFKVQAYSKQLLLFTNTTEVKGYFIFIRENRTLKN